jgi:hypothetical protein
MTSTRRRQKREMRGLALQPQKVKILMDSSNLFSHPETPEYVRSGEASNEPVENPTFSDQPKRNLT